MRRREGRREEGSKGGKSKKEGERRTLMEKKQVALTSLMTLAEMATQGP